MKVDHINKKLNVNYQKHRQKWQLSVTLSKEKKKNKKTRRYKFLNSLEIHLAFSKVQKRTSRKR